jgi:hypothetical protein
MKRINKLLVIALAFAVMACIFTVNAFATDNENTRAYELTIKTADCPDGGTNSDVYVSITGDKGTTDEVLLDGNGDDLERGDNDTYTFTGRDVGTITTVNFRIDGSDDWYPESGSINGETFAVNKWMGDETNSATKLSVPLCSLKTYNIEIKTGTMLGGATDSDIWINIMGANGSTGEFCLNSLILGNAFESGDLDSVSVTGKDVGTINNIRLRIDGEDTWNLEYVMVNDLFFNYRRNLADRNTITLTSSKYTDYEVKIKTGTYFKSGTDSEAYIKITGNSDSTGWIWINDLIDHNAFENGNTDTFTIKKAIDVGTITEISLQIERGFIDYDSWYVEYAVVNNIPFEVQQWIEEDYVIATSCEAIANYTVKLRTGTVPGSGTDSDVYLSINGTKGSTVPIYLNGLLSGNAFENGDIDTVTLSGVKDVGNIESITVYLDGGDDWYLDGMLLGEDYYPVHKWLSNSRVVATEANVTDYTITVKTADIAFAGTDGDVYVTLVGTNGKTEKILLDTSGYDDFERDDNDTYTLNMVRNVGTVTQIIFSLEDGNDWCVESIKLDGKTYTVNRWLEEDNELTIDLSSKSTVGGTAVGSIMTSGSVWIIVGIAVVLAAAAVITVIVVKKRKKNAG